jgi:hypothetical protein
MLLKGDSGYATNTIGSIKCMDVQGFAHLGGTCICMTHASCSRERCCSAEVLEWSANSINEARSVYTWALLTHIKVLAVDALAVVRAEYGCLEALAVLLEAPTLLAVAALVVTSGWALQGCMSSFLHPSLHHPHGHRVTPCRAVFAYTFHAAESGSGPMLL